jgi:hypothetical protein
MRVRLTICILAALATLTLTFSLSGQSKDPWIGVWKLNLARSTFSPGPPPRSQSVKVELQEGRVRYMYDGETADGKERRFEYTVKFDGKDYPVQGNPDTDAVAIKRTGALSYRQLNKKDGKVRGTAISTFSADGKVWTQTLTGTDAQGRPVHNAQVRERQ